jgi:hypothetical protein
MINMINEQSRKTEKDVEVTILHCKMHRAMKLELRTGRVLDLLKQESCTTQGCGIIVSFFSFF